MVQCAGLRRPAPPRWTSATSAAGYYDAFFETGLAPWDVAAGSLIVTEAGGLIGNFTGEADYLHQREVVAGNPKIYAPARPDPGALHPGHQGRQKPRLRPASVEPAPKRAAVRIKKSGRRSGR